MRTIVALALVLVAMPASADHCSTWQSTDPDATLGVPGGPTYYVDTPLPCQPDCLFSVWIYAESNDFAGLQRGDEETNDTCHGMIPADTIIF